MFLSAKDARVRRPGFTLIEMLVVIAIIAILAAAAAWAVFAMVGGTQRRNTEYTISTVFTILKTHWKAVIDEADKDDLSQFPAIVNMAGGDMPRAKVLLRKFRLMEAFPERYTDITAPFVYSADTSGNVYIPAGQQRYIAHYQSQLAAVVAAKTNPLAESGACLRLALSVQRGGGATALLDDKIKYAIADTDGDGIPELIDSFENPKQALAFFRFAWNYHNTVASPAVSMQTTLNAGSNTKSRNAKFCDPLDTDGALINPGWVNIGAAPNPNRLQFEMFFHPVTQPYPLTKKDTPPWTACYVMPVIVSAGPRLDPKTNTRPFGFTVDNTGHFAGALPLAMQPDMSIDANYLLPANSALVLDNIYSFQLVGN